MNFFSLVRRIALFGVIVFGLIFIGIMSWGWIAQKEGPMWAAVGMFVWIFISVLAWEVIGVLFGIKKTVSTRYKYWLEKHPKTAWMALSFFFLSMLSLVIHLGFVKPKDTDDGK